MGADIAGPQWVFGQSRLALLADGRLDPARLVTRRIGLDDAPAALAAPPAGG
mgnify:CR=1 FL=1